MKQGIFFGTQIYITAAHTEKDISKTVKAIKKSLKTVAKAINENNIDTMLEGNRSGAIFKEAVGANKS